MEYVKFGRSKLRSLGPVRERYELTYSGGKTSVHFTPIINIHRRYQQHYNPFVSRVTNRVSFVSHLRTTTPATTTTQLLKVISYLVHYFTLVIVSIINKKR